MPCPFCGGEASDTGHIAYNRALNDTTWADGSPVVEAFFVNCIACGTVARSGFIGGFQAKAEAVERWNTRSHEQARPAGEPVAGDASAMADLLNRAVGDIAAALILAGKQAKIAKWTAPYIHALNDFDATPQPAPVMGEA